jgi:hypothetical protein
MNNNHYSKNTHCLTTCAQPKCSHSTHAGNQTSQDPSDSIGSTQNSQHSAMARLLQLFVLVVTITATSFRTAHGRLVLTEIMIHPTKGAWFELYNTENTRISLDGWIVTSTTNDGDNFIFHTIRTTRTVLPFDYFVMGNNADSATNGGIFVDFPIGLAPFRQDGSGRNSICIFPPNSPGSGCQDVVRWSTDQPNDDYKVLPFVRGASLAKQNTEGDNTASNAASNWKASVANMNCVDGNDKGTPDKANSFECPLSPTEVSKKCGLFSFGLLCTNGCGLLGRLVGLCND